MNKAKPELSVIIPVYNRESSVSRSILSTRHLGPINYELIMVDDGSSDLSLERSRATLEFLGVPYSIRQNGENRGVSFSRNAGLDAANADWVIFLDSDDEYLEGAGEVIHAALKKDIDYVACSYIVNGVRAPELPANEDPFFYFLKKKYFNTNTIICRRKVFQSHRFREGFSVGEDTDLWARIVFDNQGVYINQAIAKYNLEHKFHLPEKHPFYDVTLPNLEISEEEKERLLVAYKKYLFRVGATLRDCDLISVLRRRDFLALLLWLIGESGYKTMWRIGRWIKK